VATAQAIEVGREVADAVASSTGVFEREGRGAEPLGPRRRDNLALYAIVFLLLGGGGATTLTGALDGDGSAALAKTAELEADVEALATELELRLDGLADDVDENATKVEAVDSSTARMLRDQARVLAWLAAASQKQTAALAAVASAAGVEVDLSSAPLLPDVEND
jgi:hypothetical protein